LCVTCLLASATGSEAGGLFRRVPEVGEWAAFDWSLTREAFSSGSPDGTIELTGTYTVTCVGEELVEGRRHLWIEIRHEIHPEERDPFWSIHKARVPEDMLVEAEFSLDGMRGWRLASRPGGEPVEFSAPDSDTDDVLRTLTYVLLGDGESDSEADERPIEVDGQEHVLTRSESGRLSLPDEFQSEEVTVTVDGTWWLSEDLAFGVPAAEFTGLHVFHARQSEWHQVMRFDLVATGGDAISELPDHH
jgi:hypothetical protein